MPAKQGSHFILTIPSDAWCPPTELGQLHPLLRYVKGQKELGEGGFIHWQVVCQSRKKCTITALKQCFCNEAHVEFTRSAAADQYVWKEDTRVADSQFEVGSKSLKRNSSADWDSVWDFAKAGDLLSIPADIRIRSYHTLKRIRKDYDTAPFRPNIQVYVFTGVSGSGKSHRMFQEAGPDYYIKSSTTKWWDGYRGESNVIIDEFRGQIAVEHLLKWCDKYPTFVEEKGGQQALKAERIWISSNKPIEEWYPDIDCLTLAALKRRVQITVFDAAFQNQEVRHRAAVDAHEEYDPGWLDNLINGNFE